jgi:hypothetical protein
MPISYFTAGTRQFTNKPSISGNVYYRLKMVLPDETHYYSNSVLLTNGSVKLLSSVVRNQVQLNAPGEYNYQLFDATGRVLSKGNLVRGINTVEVGSVKQGMLLMRVSNQHEQLTFKLVKQ